MFKIAGFSFKMADFVFKNFGLYTILLSHGCRLALLFICNNCNFFLFLTNEISGGILFVF